jgi:maleate isomerase
MLTPSSNTILEPVTAAMLANLPDVTAHFGRFRVTEISLDAASQRQFELAPILEAARLLADARIDTICWNGTSAGWLGLDRDRELCAALASATGARATSSVLALVEIFRRTEVTRFGLVTPYVDDVQQRIVGNFASEGFACVAERHLGESVNFAFSEINRAAIAARIREVAAAKPQAITVFCTNMNGAALVDELAAR